MEAFFPPIFVFVGLDPQRPLLPYPLPSPRFMARSMLPFLRVPRSFFLAMLMVWVVCLLQEGQCLRVVLIYFMGWWFLVRGVW